MLCPRSAIGGLSKDEERAAKFGCSPAALLLFQCPAMSANGIFLVEEGTFHGSAIEIAVASSAVLPKISYLYRRYHCI